MATGGGGRRKKWSEAEERTLIEKYGEMVSSGTLSKLKTREKKYKPIALFVNSMHYLRDPLAFPWQWSWKDVSTKVQNMRHQYLLVKQKILKPNPNPDLAAFGDDFDWSDGLSHWSNFLRYKDVFGDVPLVFGTTGIDACFVTTTTTNDESGHGGVEMVDFGHLGHHSGEAADFSGGIDGGEGGVLALDFEYGREEDGDEGEGGGFVYEEGMEGDVSEFRKRKKSARGFQKKAWHFLGNQLAQLKGMEMRFEQREVEREQERERREKEREKRMKESEERERRRRREEMVEWEERMSKRRCDWNQRMDDMLTQHRAEMSQLQSRIIHEHQNVSNQLLAMVSQWSPHPNGLPDHTAAPATTHYLSQIMQNLHHCNDMVHHDDTTRPHGDHHDDQFIVDG